MSHDAHERAVTLAEFNAWKDRVGRLGDRVYELERRAARIVLGKEPRIVFRDIDWGEWFRLVDLPQHRSYDAYDESTLFRKVPDDKAQTIDGMVYSIEPDQAITPVQVSIKETEAK